jgi:diguanylate cyclase
MQQTPDRKVMGYYPDSHERAREIFRLTVALLSKHKLIINPINFSLAYHYVNGEDPAFNERMGELLETEGAWQDEAVAILFRHYVCSCDEAVLKDLREELMDIVAHTLGAMIDLTGRTSVANEKIKSHIDILAESNRIESVMQAVSKIIAETRCLVTETNQFETQLVSSTEEVEKLKEELSYARQEAMLDPLTGIMNRRGFDQTLKSMIREVDQKRVGKICLVLIDIDKFKEINDNHGHLLGDKVLRAVSELLTRHTKGKDACARYGGDEFAILLPDIGSNNARNLAEYLRTVVEKIVLKRPNTGSVVGGISISIGVAAYRLGETDEDLLNRCDQALYRSKSRGRNRVTLAD